MYTQGEWVFKTDKLTPLQVKACVCQQCPFPGELGTKCDWCDNPKLMEFLRVAISAMEDFYTQAFLDTPLTDKEHEIVKQEWEKAHAIELALKEQMERVIGVIEEKMEELTSQIKSYQCPQQVPTAYLAQSYALKALKAELEGENG